MWSEIGRTVREAIATTPKTVRLIALLMVATICWAALGIF